MFSDLRPEQSLMSLTFGDSLRRLFGPFQTAALKSQQCGAVLPFSKNQKGVDLDDGKFVHKQHFLILV